MSWRYANNFIATELITAKNAHPDYIKPTGQIMDEHVALLLYKVKKMCIPIFITLIVRFYMISFNVSTSIILITKKLITKGTGDIYLIRLE